MTTTGTTTRTLADIAAEIRSDYTARSNYAALPYLDVMDWVHTADLDASPYADDNRTLVLYLLSNLAGWHGNTARRVKAELKAMLKAQPAFRR